MSPLSIFTIARNALCTLPLLGISMAGAAGAYRCDELGQSHYQNTPCISGEQHLIASDHRTKAQQTESAQHAKSDAKLARKLERQRLRAEKLSAHQPPIALSAPKPVASATNSRSASKLSKQAQPFTARSPKAKKAVSKTLA